MAADKFNGFDFGEVELDEITVFVGSDKAGNSGFAFAFISDAIR
jgi:hypothetical protein